MKKTLESRRNLALFPELRIFHTGVHAGEDTDQEPMHAGTESLPLQVVFPKGIQWPDGDIGPGYALLGFAPLLCGQGREVIEFAKVIFNGTFRIMIQRGPQIGRLSFKHKSVVWFRIVQPSGTSAKKPQLVIRIAARPFDPLAIVIIPSGQGIGNRSISIPLRRQYRFNLPPQLVTDPLIRVQDEDPITYGLVNGKVFL